MDLNSLRKEARQYIKTITASKAAPTSWSKTTLVQEETKASSLTDLVNGFDLAQSSGDKGEV